MQRLSDTAGVLKRKERQQLSRAFEAFERSFPQLFFCSHTASLEPLTNIRQYAMWLLNRGAFEDVSVTRPNEGGIMLVIDVSGKSATISYGYLLDSIITEEMTFDLLSRAHPFLLQGQYLKAILLIMNRLRKLLSKAARRVGGRDVDSLPGIEEPEVQRVLEKIREHTGTIHGAEVLETSVSEAIVKGEQEQSRRKEGTEEKPGSRAPKDLGKKDSLDGRNESDNTGAPLSEMPAPKASRIKKAGKKRGRKKK